MFIKFDFTFTLYSLQSKLGFLRPNISTNLRAFRGFPDRVCDEIATGNRTLFWTVLARRSPIACIYIDSKIYRISTDKREYRKFRCDEIVSVSSSSELGTCSKNTCTSWSRILPSKSFNRRTGSEFHETNRLIELINSHLSLKKIVPDSLEFGCRCSQHHNPPSWTAVRAATTTVAHLHVAILRISGWIDGDLQSKLCRPFSDGETSLGDIGQPERLLGYE